MLTDRRQFILLVVTGNRRLHRGVAAVALLAVAIAVGAACSGSKTNCPQRIPVLDEKCNDPDQYICEYRLPCGEKAKCVCTTTDSGGSWDCGTTDPNATPAWPRPLDAYSCASCPTSKTIQACIMDGSTLLTPPL